MQKLTIVMPILSCLMSCLMAFGQEAAGWKVGVAKVKITPAKPVWLAGYGGRDHVMEGVRQDVWAKALALEDRKGRVGVIVTLDLCNTTKELGDAMLDLIEKRHGLKREQVILNSSHTHSGPLIGFIKRHVYPLSDAQWEDVFAYSRWLTDRVADVVGEALANRRSAAVSTGNGTCRFAVNRRRNKEGELTSLTELNGARDYAVPVLKVEDLNGRTFAILFGYACHNTVLDTYLVCGDYAGYAQEEVERHHPGAIALFFQGAGADQNPLPRRKVSLAVQYGRELAAAVDQVLADDMTRREPELTFAFAQPMLALEEPMSQEEFARLIEEAEAKGVQWRVRCSRALAKEIASGEKNFREYPYPVHYWRIGDQKLFALGGEIVSGYAVEIKKRHGLDAFVMGYCDDVMSYMPTPEMWDQGGYEIRDANLCFGLPAPWKRDVTQRILDAVDRLVQGR
jgi:hypothetical protein